MRINFTRNAQINRLAALALLAICLFQLPTEVSRAAANDGEVVVLFSSIPAGIARGQTLRASLANLIKLAGREQDPVEFSARVLLYDAQGVVIARTEARTVPIDWMQSFDFNREAIPLPGEPGTGRLQVRAVLEVRFTNLNRGEAKSIEEKAAELLPASVELIDNSTGETRNQAGNVAAKWSLAQGA